MENENKNIDVVETTYKERKIGNLDIIRYNGEVVIFKGLEQYVLENELVKGLEMPNRSFLDNEYNRSARQGLFNDNEDRITLNSNQNKAARSMLHMKFTGQRLKAVKYVKALSIIATSESKYREQAVIRLSNLAEIGNRALRYKQLQNNKVIRFTEDEFWSKVLFFSMDDIQYKNLGIEAAKTDNEITKLMWNASKETKALQKNRGTGYSLRDTKEHHEYITKPKVRAMFEEALKILD